MKHILLSCAALALAACPAGTQTPAPAPTPEAPVAPAPVAPEKPVAQPQPKAEPPPAAATIPAPSASPQELAFPDESFRATQPEPTTPRPLRIPDITSFTMANGIAVYLVQSNKLPVVSLEINFDGGSMNDPDGKEGRASVCMEMISQGTQKLDKEAFDEALADIAANVSSYAGRETQGVSMSSLKKHFDATHSLYLQSLFTPGFRQREFDRIIKNRLEGLRQAKGSAASVARRVSDRVLYGAEHPFGSVVTEASLKALTVQDCVQYHADYLKPRGARLFVVGDIDQKTLRARFGKKALPAWKGKGKRSVRLPRPKSMKGKLFLVHIDNAKQSSIRFMHFGPKRKARDYFANTGAGRILGGGFSGRLNMNLREDKGYSYGARGGFAYSRDYGEFYASSSVRSDATWQSVLEIYNEIKGMKSGKAGPTSEEMERERSGAIQSLPGQFATMGQIRGAYRNLVYHKLPLNYYKKYVDRIRKVRLSQVRRSAKKHLKPNKAIVLVVGDKNAAQKKRDGAEDVAIMGADGKPVLLGAGLADLVRKGTIGRGDIVHLDADGNVIGK